MGIILFSSKWGVQIVSDSYIALWAFIFQRESPHLAGKKIDERLSAIPQILHQRGCSAGQGVYLPCLSQLPELPLPFSLV